jgi:sulfite reductase beta subunit-like hemoprotein
MKGLLKRYSLERDTDGETPERFGDWCIRAGVIKATTTAQVHVVCTEGLSNKGNFGEPGTSTTVGATSHTHNKRYSLERDTDGETPERFGDWCIRAGVIKATTDG